MWFQHLYAKMSSDTKYASGVVTSLLLVAVIDLILLIIAVLWAVFICNGGMFDIANVATRLTIIHAAHLILIFSACIIYPFNYKTIYVPFWFAIIALAVFAADIFVIVTRGVILFAGGVDFICDLFLFIFDIIFILTAIWYMALAINSTTYFGFFGATEEPTIVIAKETVIDANDTETTPLIFEKQPPPFSSLSRRGNLDYT